MKILNNTSHPELQVLFWSDFVHVLSLLLSQVEIYIGLSGGSSLDIFYSYIRDHLSEIPEDIRSRIRFVLLDERIVPAEHPDSNLGQLRKKCLTHLIENEDIDEDQIIGIDRIYPDMARAYSDRVPRIDIALVGVGPDGHIASLFPHHPLLDSTLSCYLEITDSPKLPAHRITISPLMLRSASYIFVAFMRGKEAVYARFLDDTVAVMDCPVRILTQCENLVIMSDIDE